ncbi:hypothetical protein SVIOM74S_07872 [Streptomyces violarus]
MRPSPLHPARVYRRSGIHDPVLRRGYEACRRATRARGEIEYAVSLLLPPPLRIATWALYGAGVTVDCLADTAGVADMTEPPDMKDAGRAERLEAWIAAFDADLRDGRSTDPVRQALIHTMLTWNLPPGFMHTQFEQLRLDVHGRRFATWQEWRRYNSLVTTPFVLRAASLMMRVAGLSAEPEAIASGVPDAAVAWQLAVDALVLTDALMDLSEDLADGHVPLPQEALDEAGVRRGVLAPSLCHVGREQVVAGDVGGHELDAVTKTVVVAGHGRTVPHGCSDRVIARCRGGHTPAPRGRGRRSGWSTTGGRRGGAGSGCRAGSRRR